MWHVSRAKIRYLWAQYTRMQQWNISNCNLVFCVAKTCSSVHSSATPVIQDRCGTQTLPNKIQFVQNWPWFGMASRGNAGVQNIWTSWSQESAIDNLRHAATALSSYRTNSVLHVRQQLKDNIDSREADTFLHYEINALPISDTDQLDSSLSTWRIFRVTKEL